jgi:predicted metal-binding membrane protein
MRKRLPHLPIDVFGVNNMGSAPAMKTRPQVVALLWLHAEKLGVWHEYGLIVARERNKAMRAILNFLLSRWWRLAGAEVTGGAGTHRGLARKESGN